MIKSVLLAAAITLPCAPILAQGIESPKSTPAVVSGNVPALMGSFGGGNTPPAISLYAVNIQNNISCRNKARSKYFELGARDMSRDDLNAQWGTVGTMQAVVWCRDSQAIIAVAGNTPSSVKELRDEIVKAF